MSESSPNENSAPEPVDQPNANEGSNSQPALFWSTRQVVDHMGYTDDQLDYQILLDERMTGPLIRQLRESWLELFGEPLALAATWNELPVMPAGVASEFVGFVLSRAEVADFAACRGLEDPHLIAERLKASGTMKAERDRSRVRAMFGSDPLPLTMEKLPQFPVNALPPVLADMAIGIARELGVDPAMTAMFGLGAVSGALCGRIVVRVYDNWIENGVSYILVVDESGGRKTPAFTAMCNDPLMAVQLELIERHHQHVHEPIDEEIEMISAAREVAVNQEPRLLASDVTTEQLGVLMAENGECMIVADAEGDVFDILSGRYANKGGGPPNLSLYLKSYSRERVDVDRAGRGRVHLTHPALTLCLATQPTVWYAVVANEWFAGKGFLARLEVAFPETRLQRAERLAAQGLLDGDPVPVAPEVVTAYRAMIRKLALELYTSLEITAGFTKGAEARMKRHTAEIDARRRADGDLCGKLSHWAAKCSGRVARRALHLHMAEQVAKCGPTEAAGKSISVETVECAIEIEEWLIANMREAYGLAQVGTDLSAEDVTAFVDWLIREHRKSPHSPIFLTHIVQTAHPRSARRASVRDKLIALLVDLHYLVHIEVGKKKAVYLNPTAADMVEAAENLATNHAT